MKNDRMLTRRFLGVTGGILLTILPVEPGHAAEDMLRRAEGLFQEGQFEKAAEAFREILDKDPAQQKALVGLGQVALLKNDYQTAESSLKKALALDPNNKDAKRFMAEVNFRQDRYIEAAGYLRDIGQQGMADRLEAFGDRRPNQIEGAVEKTEIPFLQTDPLPVVLLRVNGREASFVIDTGAPTLILDKGFAESIGVKKLGQREGTFAGGLKAVVNLGTADVVQLGDYTVRNVPVSFNETPMRIPFQTEKPIGGILGTCLLYHFIFSLDYPGGKLVLRRPTPELSKKLRAADEASGAIVMPFWMAGDHFIVVWGRVNNSAPHLFFVDTGMAGGGFLTGEEFAAGAAIKLGEAGEGIGGGGTVSFRQVVVDRLSLGDAVEENVNGAVSATPPLRIGFRMPAIISHQFFRPYRLTFDFLAMTLSLKRATPGAVS